MESAGRDFLVSKLSSLVPAADFQITPASLAVRWKYMALHGVICRRCHVREHFYYFAMTEHMSTISKLQISMLLVKLLPVKVPTAWP